ncbi:zf-HC2 domain-containing protein [Streptomycetaceae bacterium NBC_01309]
MECRDWQEVLSAVMDGEAAAAEARAAREHADGCPECSRWSAGAAALGARVADGVGRRGGAGVGPGAAPGVEPGADAVERVLKALREGGA